MADHVSVTVSFYEMQSIGKCLIDDDLWPFHSLVLLLVHVNIGSARFQINIPSSSFRATATAN